MLTDAIRITLVLQSLLACGCGSSATTSTGDGGGEDVRAPDVMVLPETDSASPGAPQGPPGFALVSGGAVMSSVHYTCVTSLAQAPGGNGITSSAHDQLRGGLVGATQP